MLRRKAKKPVFEMSKEEMQEEIRQAASQALVFAKQGDVSAMETMLERAAALAEQIRQRLPRDQVDQIKRVGYQKGVDEMKQRIEALRAEGNKEEAQRLQQLLYSYQGELLSLQVEGTG